MGAQSPASFEIEWKIDFPSKYRLWLNYDDKDGIKYAQLIGNFPENKNKYIKTCEKEYHGLGKWKDERHNMMNYIVLQLSRYTIEWENLKLYLKNRLFAKWIMYTDLN